MAKTHYVVTDPPREFYEEARKLDENGNPRAQLRKKGVIVVAMKSYIQRITSGPLVSNGQSSVRVGIYALRKDSLGKTL